MPCVGSSSFVSSAASRFLWPACHDLSVSVSRMHTCHFELLPDLIMSQFFEIIRLILCSRCRQNADGIRWQSWCNEKYWVVHCTSNCLPILGHLWSFAVFHSYEYPRFEQSSWSNRITGVSSNNCTVTNRSRSWTKTCAYSFICTAPVAVSRIWDFWSFSKYPLYLSSILLAQHCALKPPNP